MNRKRLTGTLLAAGGLLIVAVALAQSNGETASDTSKEWPTYGHDSGGMRFSPLTQITPANVGKLKVAWVYHMRPPGPLPPVGRGGGEGESGAGRGRGAVAAEGEAGAVPQGRGRGR